MSTYVIGDIHGCMDEFKQMLDNIHFSDDDILILTGDYIDRGKQNKEMLDWLLNKPENVIAIKGNHDITYCAYVNIMQIAGDKRNLNKRYDSQLETMVRYSCAISYLTEERPWDSIYFDYYKTLDMLINDEGVTFAEMLEWKDMIDAYPYYVELQVNGRDYVVVHASYREDSTNTQPFDSIEEYYVYARDEALDCGVKGKTIVAGHSPTIFKDLSFYNDGKIFKYHKKKDNMSFYNVDCGCVYREKYKNARLACIRLEDEKEFYV